MLADEIRKNFLRKAVDRAARSGNEMQHHIAAAFAFKCLLDGAQLARNTADTGN